MIRTHRTPSPQTLALVRAMSTDPASPKSLRSFHREQLQQLERRVQASARMDNPPRRSPFSRFTEALENTNTTTP